MNILKELLSTGINMEIYDFPEEYIDTPNEWPINLFLFVSSIELDDDFKEVISKTNCEKMYKLGKISSSDNDGGYFQYLINNKYSNNIIKELCHRLNTDPYGVLGDTYHKIKLNAYVYIVNSTNINMSKIDLSHDEFYCKFITQPLQIGHTDLINPHKMKTPPDTCNMFYDKYNDKVMLAICQTSDENFNYLVNLEKGKIEYDGAFDIVSIDVYFLGNLSNNKFLIPIYDRQYQLSSQYRCDRDYSNHGLVKNLRFRINTEINNVLGKNLNKLNKNLSYSIFLYNSDKIKINNPNFLLIKPN